VCEVPDLAGIKPADDVAEYLLVAPQSLDPARLAFSSTRAAFAVLLGRLDEIEAYAAPR
jgi:hypothetical protein